MTGRNCRTASRRRFLVTAGLGAVTLAGCLDAVDDDNDGPVRFDSGVVDDVLATPVLHVEEPAPVQPEPAAVERVLDRIDDLLAGVPQSVDADRIPNEVVREEVEHLRDDALEGRERVADGEGFHALRAGYGARADARECRVAYDAVDEDVVPELDAHRETVRDAVEDRIASVPYAGDDPSRTALFAARLESDLETADAYATRELPPVPSVLDVGDWAGDVEDATARLDAWDHLADRHRDRTDDPESFAAGYGSVLDVSASAIADLDLHTHVQAGVDAIVDDIEGDADHRAAERLLRDVVWGRQRAVDRFTEARDRGNLGLALRAAFAVERAARALAAVRDRFGNDEFPPLEEADQIRVERDAALEALDAAPVDPTVPTIPGAELAGSYAALRSTDDYMERYARGDVTLDREYASYAHLRAIGETYPGAIETFRDRMSEAFDPSAE